MLQVIPISLAALYSMTDPETKSLCVINFPVVYAPWSHSPAPAMRFPGPLPMFRDRRGNDAKNASVFPRSEVIKKFVSISMISCSHNPDLEALEVGELNADRSKFPPLRNPIVAVWPEIPRDKIPSAQDPSPLSNVNQSRG